MADLRSILQEIYDGRGKLTPALVVAEARDPGNPLHSRFEWDDEAAAECYRLVQAGELIRSVKIVYKTNHDGSKERVRAFHSVRAEQGRSYEPAEVVATDPLLRQMMLRKMEHEWRQMRQRYQNFDEFWKMVRDDIVSE